MFELLETLDLSKLDAIFFDFDGVLVDSNQIKDDAFIQITRAYSPEIQNSFIAHHRANQGVGRSHKFRYLLEELLHVPPDLVTPMISSLSKEYSELVFQSVTQAREMPGSTSFLKLASKKTRCFLISGTPEDELRLITQARGLAAYFTSIHGSPASKTEHLAALKSRYSIPAHRSLFIGDSTTDFTAAHSLHIPFASIPGYEP